MHAFFCYGNIACHKHLKGSTVDKTHQFLLNHGESRNETTNMHSTGCT
jgi:hypothetical protein